MENNKTTDHKIIETFAKRIIDYAGLFPPASLDLKTAFSNFIKYQDSNFRWMLSKFVISAKRLPELTLLLDNKALSLTSKINFSILGGSEVATSKFFESLEDDINKIQQFKSKYTDEVLIGCYEVRIPLELFIMPDHKKIIQFFSKVSDCFFEKLKLNIPVFYEAIPNKDLIHLAKAIKDYNLSNNFAGYKIRTGGIEPSAFPAPEKIANAIKVCVEYDAPVKCTAGLHHPIRHYDNSVKTKMHGFINVFCAGIFAFNLDLNEHELIRILMEEDPDKFIFSDDFIRWENYEVFKEEIQEAREKFMFSFGSCSFEEPVNDLISLKLLSE